MKDLYIELDEVKRSKQYHEKLRDQAETNLFETTKKFKEQDCQIENLNA